jgi:hypothetical protein
MTRATTALAPRSGQSGVLFHGMAGAGKTACALELAYVHQSSFPLMAWHAAPQEGHEIRAALTDFALALEQQLPGLKLVHLVPDAGAFRQFLPTLTEILEQNRILVVLDNIESLLTQNGDWRDERWRWLIDAMTGHRGLSRLVLSSRLLPAVPDGMLVEAVHGLTLSESVLLAREWPNLRALIDTNPTLAGRTLSVVQGHPKLIELANGLAANPGDLAERLDDADETWQVRGTRLEQFLRSDQSAATGDDYLTVLVGWTHTIVAALPGNAAILFQFLCRIQESDRRQDVAPVIWPHLWKNLEKPGPPPAFDSTMSLLIDRALVDARHGHYQIHPGVAESGLATVPDGLARVVDALLIDYWRNTLIVSIEREHEQQLGWLIREAAYSAVPYLMRQGEWSLLAKCLEEVMVRDSSEATAAAFLPFLAITAEAVSGTDYELTAKSIYARAQLAVSASEAETTFQEVLEAAITAGDSRLAHMVTSELVYICRRTGRLAEAEALLGANQERLPGSGPWTRLANEASKLDLPYLEAPAIERMGEIGPRRRLAARQDRTRTVQSRPGPAEHRCIHLEPDSLFQDSIAGASYREIFSSCWSP